MGYEQKAGVTVNLAGGGQYESPTAGTQISYENMSAEQAAQAVISATTATEQAAIATTQAGTATSAASTATTQAGIATSAASTATTQAGTATSAASTATTQAGIATTGAATATAQAGIATTQATNASNSASAALSSENAAAASYDSFDDRYLGAKSEPPTIDNDGAALLTGALYWDTAIPGMRSWNGSAWVTLPAATASAVANTPAGGIAATNVQTAINELDTEKANLASPTFTASDKATPVDADSVLLADSAAAGILKKLTWANLKAAIKTYLSGVSFPIGSTTPSTVAATTLSATGKLTVGAKAILEAPAWDTGYLALRHSALAETAATSALFQSAGGSTFLNSVAGQPLYLGINGAVVGAVTSTGLSVTGTLRATGLISSGTANTPAGSVNAVVMNGIQLTHFGNGGVALLAGVGGGFSAYTHTGAVGSETYRQDMVLDSSGNLLVGATSGSHHIIQKTGANVDGTLLLGVSAGTNTGAVFYGSAAVGGFGNAANAILRMGMASASSRSINAAGTVNASGADYAEYESNNGLMIAKGDIVGFKADGTLTSFYTEAIRFAIKSTNPSYVGGDTWGSEDQVGKRPEQPADDAGQEAKDTYVSELAVFEAALEAARQSVDRIAYSGKVPCNVYGAVSGDYIIAAPTLDGGIHGITVTKSEMTFSQYQDAVGRVNRILEDGRCEVAVIIH
jgi:hypothetical protein